MRQSSKINPVNQILSIRRYSNDAYIQFGTLLEDGNPETALTSGKLMAKAWAKSLDLDEVVPKIRTFALCSVRTYWQILYGLPLKQWPLPKSTFQPVKLDKAVITVADAIGRACAQLTVTEACNYLGNLYSGLLPEALKATNGIFYTPTALCHRLINLSTDAGVNWRTAKIADPACGAGAFLVPIVFKIRESLQSKSAENVLKHIENHLRGYELDEFAAWLTQVFIEVALKGDIVATGRRVGIIVKVGDSLTRQYGFGERFDLVIGNPPYGKVKLNDAIKKRFQSSLYGHPNLYGLFTHLALDIAKENGVISYLTPTSFLSGEYFKNLRAYIRAHSMPVEMDFVALRKGVFDDVLQETMLSTYRKKSVHAIPAGKVMVNEVVTSSPSSVRVTPIDKFHLPTDTSSPWILPKKVDQCHSIQAMEKMPTRLADWGYRVSTGQLVWNRFKDQLTDKKFKNSYPIVWAEAITQNGQFVLKADKKNHSHWFNFENGNESLLSSTSCILLQRTTAKEQEKRLIATVLPQETINKYGAVVIENHLNMIIADKKPSVDMATVAAFLNSKAVNNAFRTISGSVAVSAYELEALPLPAPSQMKELTKLIRTDADIHELERECAKLYSY